tara:strand:+ start:286 stop:441 length:156 start_codon:yes stop_codon:yes gene_type:complete
VTAVELKEKDAAELAVAELVALVRKMEQLIPVVVAEVVKRHLVQELADQVL